MSDERLRELERRFRETGALEDEAAWLGARVRAGLLSAPQLTLAAYLGHEASRRVLGEEAPGWFLDMHEPLPAAATQARERRMFLMLKFQALEGFPAALGGALQTRLLVAIAEALRPALEAAAIPAGDSWRALALALQAVEAGGVDPDELRVLANEHVDPGVTQLLLAATLDGLTEAACQAAYFAAQPRDGLPTGHPFAGAWQGADSLLAAIEVAVQREPRAVLDAFVERVVPWVLEQSPAAWEALAERAEAERQAREQA